MMVTVLKQLFLRDLGKLKTEITLYQNEQRIWHVEKQIANTAGNLCLHLIGNLNTYIGAEFAQTGYVRNRPLEFSAKDVPRSELIRRIDETISVIEIAFSKLSDEQLTAEYPQDVLDQKVTNGYFLTHLAMHLSYHLGQINYHRRLLDN
ncbi:MULTISPECIES: DUF1572 family protein [Olivibacter]|jgi:uncharacterized damage-inducible protein DinB|uniref:DUF1572 family protein n=1 Tax=Olivibacter oleidegradans TaxID=760123 RepID=A0ABV6HPN5_9SPHI|nr:MULTISPECIES: DUF1572 family protein [Olivibacter]MCL4640556.1 DUF1572 family protein [Olivibacter sp. UJ_SKK_5.1]MDM8173747.1 DUF1572 family protein [Olivibacter sp. 47]MDX3914934.1 DUF1572 family protein [Pseudosphingobacterium sp.]QEL03543.1 DUF1572 domain-containing protein [Olivibacter sp. LS-1]